MNLHGLVRPAIKTVNPDIQAVIMRSAGWIDTSDGFRVPRYLAQENVMINVQPLTGGALRRAEFLNLQGVMRVIYDYGDDQGIVRVLCKGGDIFQFAEYPGEPITQWLVTEVLETWAEGWSKVIATLQVSNPV